MTQDVKIDMGSAIPYAVDTFKKLIGKDSISEDFKELIKRLYRTASELSSHVQCIGMSKPIPIDKIYQNTKLSDSQFHDFITTDVTDVVYGKGSFIVFAGPGDGKTTLSHWLYNFLLPSEKHLPVLITLRLSGAIEDLIKLVDGIEKGRSISKDNKEIILIVDGYDEITLPDRKRVSNSLVKFNSLDIGKFCLTCRNHYDIIALPAKQFWIRKFSAKNAIDFCKKFFEAYEVNVDATKMIRNLRALGLGSFAEHPLMLTLVCIIYTSTKKTMPKNTLRLISEAIRTLTYRWDEHKGVDRECKTILDGEERIRCLSMIAFNARNFVLENHEIQSIIHKFLFRQQIQKVDASILLDEIVQWFGIIVPVSVGQWGFIHRTIHDYLAAKYWVENAEFTIENITQWDTRAAYAMCRMPDATKFIGVALRHNCEPIVIAQCLVNNAVFDSNVIAPQFTRYLQDNDIIECKITKNDVSASISTVYDVFPYATDIFLNCIILAQKNNSLKNNAVAIILYCLNEFTERKTEINKSAYDLATAILGKYNSNMYIKKGVRVSEIKLNNLVVGN